MKIGYFIDKINPNLNGYDYTSKAIQVRFGHRKISLKIKLNLAFSIILKCFTNCKSSCKKWIAIPLNMVSHQWCAHCLRCRVERECFKGFKSFFSYVRIVWTPTQFGIFQCKIPKQRPTPHLRHIFISWLPNDWKQFSYLIFVPLKEK